MRHDRNLNRWWSVAPDFGPTDWLIIALLCALILILSGCGTMASPSACPPLSVPTAATDAVPSPIPLPDDPTPEDLLENVAANGERSNDLRSRLLTIKVWAAQINERLQGIWVAQ